MITTYIIDEFEPSARQVKITFVNEEGLVHERQINIPHLDDGSIDEEYFQEIIEGQLRGVENKIKIGVIKFIDPNENVGLAST